MSEFHGVRRPRGMRTVNRTSIEECCGSLKPRTDLSGLMPSGLPIGDRERIPEADIADLGGSATRRGPTDGHISALPVAVEDTQVEA